MRIFTARSGEAESTVLPTVTSWVQEAFSDVPEVRSTDDHGVVLWWNMPACAVLSSSKYDFGITSISNLLAQYPRNGLALVIHPNRASHAAADRTPLDSSDVHIMLFYSRLGATTSNHCSSPSRSVRKRFKREHDTKDEDDDDEDPTDPGNTIKKEEPGDSDADSDGPVKEEESEVRDLKYKLESLWLHYVCNPLEIT